MHAVVISGALALSVFGLTDELLSLRSERVLAATVYAMAVASVTYAAVLAAAVGRSGQNCANAPPQVTRDYFALKSSWQLSQALATALN